MLGENTRISKSTFPSAEALPPVDDGPDCLLEGLSFRATVFHQVFQETDQIKRSMVPE